MKEIFLKSFAYYMNNPTELSEIYDKVNELLIEQKNKNKAH